MFICSTAVHGKDVTLKPLKPKRLKLCFCVYTALNSWKLKTAQFLHDQHTHRALNMFRFLKISSSFTQSVKMSEPTVHNLINLMPRRCVALYEANAGHTTYRQVYTFAHCNNEALKLLSASRISELF